MGLLDLDDFNELLLQHSQLRIPFDNYDTTSEETLANRVKELRIREQQEYIESCLDPDDVPPDYFFSVMAEMILNDDI